MHIQWVPDDANPWSVRLYVRPLCQSPHFHSSNPHNFSNVRTHIGATDILYTKVKRDKL